MRRDLHRALRKRFREDTERTMKGLSTHLDFKHSFGGPLADQGMVLGSNVES